MDNSVIIKTTLDTRKFKRGVQEIVDSQSAIAGAAQGIQGQFSKISQSAEKFQASMGRVSNSLKSMANLGKKVSGGIFSFANFDTSSLLTKVRKAVSSFKNFGKQTDILEGKTRSLSNAVKSAAGLLGTAFAAKGLADFASTAIEAASDLTEVQNVVDVTFGSMSDDINQFSKAALDAFGLSETSAKQYASTMGAMLKSMGITGDAMLNMSKSITALSADMASFYNLDPSEAFQKIRSGISGETEPLKQLGINLSVANLEAYALSRGITKSYQSMTQAEQAILRYNYLLSVTADAQGDFARTSDSWANQTKILKERFQAIKATLGQGFINAFTPILRVINTLLSRLASLANSFKSFTEMIFGAQDAEDTSGTGYESSIAGADQYAESMDNVTESTEEAEKAQSKYMSGLDEMRTWSDSTKDNTDFADSLLPSDGYDFGSIDIDSSPLAKASQELSDRLSAIFDVFKKAWENQGQYVIDSALYAFEKWKDAAKAVGKTLYDVFTDGHGQAFIESLLFDFGSLLDLIGSIGDAFKKAWERGSGKEFTTNLFEALTEIFNLAGKIKKTFADMFKSETGVRLIESYIQRWSSLLALIRDVATTASKVWDDRGSGIVEGWARMWTSINDSVTAFHNTLRKVWNSGDGEDFLNTLCDLLEDAQETVELIAGSFKELWNSKEGEKFLKSILKLLNEIGKVIDSILVVWNKVWKVKGTDTLKSISSMLTSINGLFTQIGQTFRKVWENGTGEKVLGHIHDLVQGISGLIDSIANGWKKAFASKAGEAFIQSALDLLDEIIGFINDITAGWKKAFDKHGQEAVESVLDALSKINNLLKTIAQSFRDAFTDEKVENIFSTLYQTGKNISDTIGNIAENFEKAWKKAETGKGILDTIYSIIEDAGEALLNMSAYTEEWSKKLDFTSLLQSIQQLLESCEPLVKSVFDGIAWAYENIFLPLADFTISEVLPRFFETLSYVIDIFNNVLEALKPLFNWFWNNVLQPIVSFVGDTFLAFWDLLNKALKGFADWCRDNKGVIQAITVVLGAFFAVWAFEKVITGVNSAMSKVSMFFNLLKDSGGVFGVVKNAITNFLPNLTKLGSGFSGAIKKVGEFCTSIKSGEGGGLTGAISSAIGKCGDWIKNLIGVGGVTAATGEAASALSGAAAAAGEAGSAVAGAAAAAGEAGTAIAGTAAAAGEAGAAMTGAAGSAGLMSGVFSSLTAAAVNPLTYALIALGGAVVTAAVVIKGEWNDITNFMDSASKNFSNSIERASNSLKITFTDDVEEGTRLAAKNTGLFYGNETRKAIEAHNNLIGTETRLKAGILRMKGETREEALEHAAKMVEDEKGEWGKIVSNADVYWGRYIPDAVIDNLKQMNADVKQQAEETGGNFDEAWAEARRSFTRETGYMVDEAGKIIPNINGILKTDGPKLKEGIDPVVAGVYTAIDESGNKIYKKVHDDLGDITYEFSKNGDEIVRTVSSTGDKVMLKMTKVNGEMQRASRDLLYDQKDVTDKSLTALQKEWNTYYGSLNQATKDWLKENGQITSDGYQKFNVETELVYNDLLSMYQAHASSLTDEERLKQEKLLELLSDYNNRSSDLVDMSWEEYLNTYANGGEAMLNSNSGTYNRLIEDTDTAYEGVLKSVQEGTGEVGDATEKGFQESNEISEEKLNDLTIIAETNWEGVAESAREGMNAVGHAVSSASVEQTAQLEKKWSALNESMELIWQAFGQTAKTQFDNMGLEVFKSTQTAVTNIVDAWKTINGQLDSVWDEMVTHGRNSFLKMGDNIASTVLETGGILKTSWQQNCDSVQKVFDQFRLDTDRAFKDIEKIVKQDLDQLQASIKSKLDTTQKNIDSSWNSIKVDASSGWNNIWKAIDAEVSRWSSLLQNHLSKVKTTMTDGYDQFRSLTASKWSSISQAWLAEAGTWATKLVSPMQSMASQLKSGFDVMQSTAQTAGMNIVSALIQGMQSNTQSAGSFVSQLATNLSNAFKQLADNARTWGFSILANLSNGMTDGWNERLNSNMAKIRDLISGYFSNINTYNIGYTMMDRLNSGICDYWNNTLKKSFDTISNYMKNSLNVSGNVTVGINKVSGSVKTQSLPGELIGQVPMLATGAVIPANSPFLAILGDQKSGNNIETPEKLLRQIVREELSNIRIGGGSETINLVLDGKQIYQTVLDRGKREKKRLARNPFNF